MLRAVRALFGIPPQGTDEAADPPLTFATIDSSGPEWMKINEYNLATGVNLKSKKLLNRRATSIAMSVDGNVCCY